MKIRRKMLTLLALAIISVIAMVFGGAASSTPIHLGELAPGDEIVVSVMVDKGSEVNLDKKSSKYLRVEGSGTDEKVKIVGNVPKSANLGQTGSFWLTVKGKSGTVSQEWTFDVEMPFGIEWGDGQYGRFTQAYQGVKLDTPSSQVMYIHDQLVSKNSPHHNADYAYQERLQLAAHKGATAVDSITVWGTANDFIAAVPKGSCIWNNLVRDSALNQTIGINSPAGWLVLEKKLDNGDSIYELSRCGNWLTTNKVVNQITTGDPKPVVPPDTTPKLDHKDPAKGSANQNPTGTKDEASKNQPGDGPGKVEEKSTVPPSDTPPPPAPAPSPAPAPPPAAPPESGTGGADDAGGISAPAD